MKKLLIFSILFCLIYTVAVAKPKQEESLLKSTQGLETDAQISKNAVKSKSDKHSAKSKHKNRNKYLRYVNKTNKSKEKKIIRERDLYFLNQQLTIKKHKLEELNSEVKKGEYQE